MGKHINNKRLRWAYDQCPLPGSSVPSLQHTRWYCDGHHDLKDVIRLPDGYTTTVFSSPLFSWLRSFSLTPPALTHQHSLITVSEWLPRYQPTAPGRWRAFGRHYTCAYARLHEDYLTDWSSQAKRHLKKFHRSGVQLRLGTRAEVVALYATSQVPKTMQAALLKILDQHLNAHPDTIDILVAEKNHHPVACFVAGNCDEGKISEYILGAFHPNYKQDHPMVGLIDWWYQKSLSRGYQLLTFGHMDQANTWWVPMPSTGYSLFKTHFGVQRVWFPKNHWRIIFNHRWRFSKLYNWIKLTKSE